jgi:predicted CoA-binding protein
MSEPEPDLRAILEQTHTIAVLGAHWEPQRAACYVPEYLASVGYRVLPVNPIGVGRSGFGAPFVGSLAALSEAVDMVDVFRRAELLPAHEAEILAMTPRPAVVWLQLGIRSDAFADRLRTAGITVVQDRCTLAEHRRLGLPSRGRA